MHSGDAGPASRARDEDEGRALRDDEEEAGSHDGAEPSGLLLGIISDGDLRRLLEGRGPYALTLTAGDAMNSKPHTIAADELAARGLAIMEERRITSLVVTNDEQHALGILHLHDLWGLELI